MLLALLATGLVAAVLAAPVVARAGASANARRAVARRTAAPRAPLLDPGRERRAEQRARQLLRSCVNEEEWAMYRDLGFVEVASRLMPQGRRADEASRHAYLVYPHRPIVAFMPESGQLLGEYCVEFPDVAGGKRRRLPASDDVLAKWMALTSDETRVIGAANMHLVGRQHDPVRVERDLWRLSEWRRRRAAGHGVGAGAA